MFDDKNLNKQKKFNKKLFLILGSAGIVVLVAAVTTIFLLIEKPTSKTADKISTSNTTLPKLSDFLKSSFKNATNFSSMIYKSTNSSTVISKLKDGVWVVSDDGISVLTFSSIREDINDNKNDYNLLVKNLRSEGFIETKTLGNSTINYDSTKPTAQYFVSDNFVCNVHNEPETKHNSLRADCADKTGFDKNNKSYKSFAEVYKVGNKDIMFSKINVQNSFTKNYKNASIVASDLIDSTDYQFAMFYQKPGGKWYYFTQIKSQDKLNCSDYKTDDLVNAFIGFTCWDNVTNKSSFVNTKQPTFTTEPGAIGG